MSLRPGARLGSYEITGPLGEGGMGVVYRATDPKLKREVAIKVLPEAGLQKPTSASRDRKGLLLDSEVDERIAIFALDLESRRARPLREGGFNDAHGVISPDGRWLAFDSDETGRPEVFVTPFPGPGRSWPVSTDGGRYPEWRGDGREIVYAALDGRFLAVPVTPEGDTFRAGAATELFRSTPPTRDYRDWGMSPDGQLFAVVPSGVLGAKNELRLIVNWPARRDRR